MTAQSGAAFWARMKYAFIFLAVCLAPTSRAALMTKPVAYEQGGVKLVGYLAYDDARASVAHPAPGVLVVHEWWGLNAYAKDRAEALAKLGYVAFAADMYGAGAATEDPKKAAELSAPFYGKPLMAERARAGLDRLLATGLVAPGKVAAIGYCFGGSAVQALAYSGAPLAAVVSFHGIPVVPTDAQAEAIKGKMLICQGALDPFVKPESLHAQLSALDRAGVDYEFVSYAGAVHAFTNPDATRLAKAAGISGIGYNEAAARRSWRHMRDLFDEIFAH